LDWEFLPSKVLLNSTLDLSGNQNVVFVKFNKPLTTTAQFRALPMLSGFTLTNTTQTISVSVFDAGFNQTGINVVVISDSGLTAVTLSYFVFNPESASFANYGQVITVPILPNSTSRLVLNRLSVLRNFLYGVNSFSMGSAPSVSFESSIDSNFALDLVLGQIITRFAFTYVLFGISPVFTCANCNVKLAD
jgi:hypothetical protein